MLLTIPLVGYLSQNKASGPITGLCYPMFLTVTNWRGNGHCQTAGRRGFESSTRGDVHSKKHYVIWHNIKLRATENKLSKKTESFYCTLVPFSFWWIAPNCVLGDRSAVTFTLSTVYSRWPLRKQLHWPSCPLLPESSSFRCAIHLQTWLFTKHFTIFPSPNPPHGIKSRFVERHSHQIMMSSDLMN